MIHGKHTIAGANTLYLKHYATMLLGKYSIPSDTLTIELLRMPDQMQCTYRMSVRYTCRDKGVIAVDTAIDENALLSLNHPLNIEARLMTMVRESVEQMAPSLLLLGENEWEDVDDG